MDSITLEIVESDNRDETTTTLTLRKVGDVGGQTYKLDINPVDLYYNMLENLGIEIEGD